MTQKRKGLKRKIAVLLSLALMASSFFVSRPAAAEEQEGSQTYLEDREERLSQWYDDAKVGMMYHFGVQTGDARDISSSRFENYQFKTIEEYNAALEDVDIKDWVAQAKKVGAKYIEFAGFHSCLGYVRPWHSDVPGIPTTERDLLGELIEEAHKEEIKVVVYMTTSLNHANHDPYDWYHPEEYVEYAKQHHAEYTTKKNGGVPLTDEQWEMSFDFVNSAYGFGAFTFDEIEYLMKNYDIDGFWFDAYCNPTWYPENEYPWASGYEYDGCWGGCPDQEAHEKNFPKMKKYRYDEEAFNEYYFYKRDILQHVHDLDPDCVTFVNNFAPIIPADVVSQETVTHNSGYKFVGGSISEATFITGGFGNPGYASWWYTVPRDVHNQGELKRIVYNAMQDGCASVAQGPSLDAEYPEYENEFNDFMAEFNSWSGEAWLDKEAVKSDKIGNSNESAGTDVMTVYNDKEDAYYVHIFSSDKGSEVTVTDSVRFLGKAADLKTGEEIPYVQRNGQITFQIDDWSTYDTYGDLIIKIESNEESVDSQTAADYITRTYVPETDGFWLVYPEVVEGFQTELISSSDESVVDLDGFVSFTEEEKTTKLKFKVTNLNDESDTAETGEIEMTVSRNSAEPMKIPQSQMSASATSCYINDSGTWGADKALDGNRTTMWHSNNGMPQSITVDLGGTYQVSEIRALPRYDGRNTDILQYKLYVSTDGTAFEEAASGTWESEGDEQTICLETPREASYIRLEALEAAGDGSYCGVSELNVLYKPEAPEISKDILQKAIDEAEAVEAGEYYTKDVLALRQEIEKAKLVVEKENPSDKEMVMALEAINEKLAALQKIGENIALGKTAATDESYNSTFTGAQAVDGDMHTRWATRSETAVHYMEIDFQGQQTLNRIVIKALAGTEFPVAVKAVPFKLSYKNESGEWVECFNSENESYTADGRLEVTVPPITEENLQEYIDNWPYTGCVHVNKNTGEVLHTLITAEFDSVTTDALRYEILEPKAVSLIEFEAYSVIDKSKLQEVYDTYKDTENEDYPESSWAVFAEALKEAETLLAGNYNPTQEEMDAAIEKLQSAFEGLETNTVSKKTLEYFLNSAIEHVANGDTDDCVQSIKDLFTEAIAEGEAVMADDGAAREEIMNAAVKLMKAVQALDMKAGSKTDLEMAVELGDLIDLSKYVEAGQQEFTEALAAAKDVLADGDAMQGDIDSAWNALADAMANLRLKADKSVLEDLINEAVGLDLSKYTEDSAAAFRTALAKAEAVLADDTLSVEDQENVDAAAAELNAAIGGLAAQGSGAEERSDDISDGDAGSQNPGGESREDLVKAESAAVKTGDSSDFAMAAILCIAVFAGMGIMVLKYRKYR